jgi:hypothetical protein
MSHPTFLRCLQSPDNPFKNPDKVVAHVVLLTPPTYGLSGADSTEAAAKQLHALSDVLSKLQVSKSRGNHAYTTHA